MDGAGEKLSPLMTAVFRGDTEEEISLLAAESADINAGETKDCLTPLMLASNLGREEVARLLIKAGAQVDLPHQFNGMTPLMWAASKGHCGVAR